MKNMNGVVTEKKIAMLSRVKIPWQSMSMYQSDKLEYPKVTGVGMSNETEDVRFDRFNGNAGDFTYINVWIV